MPVSMPWRDVHERGFTRSNSIENATQIISDENHVKDRVMGLMPPYPLRIVAAAPAGALPRRPSITVSRNLLWPRRASERP